MQARILAEMRRNQKLVGWYHARHRRNREREIRMHARINLFFAWFFIPQTLAMGWVAAVGRIVLEVLGTDTYEGDIPGRMVGAVLLLGAIYLFLHYRGSLPPEGKPEGNGYRIGHRSVLLGNVLAAMLFVFQFVAPLIDGYNTHLILDNFTTAFGYWAMACWVVGFSLLYQSAQPRQSEPSTQSRK